ncbi:hypothetical protein Tco_0728389 [Tanacetum coccineum]|uniref:Uncharacterized protein n=1 Tax=Tanacetum coccineum TaxID=301880 RepID=A0ABQ4YL04_9ASTR
MGKNSGQREIRPVWNNTQRINHQNKFVPSTVLTRSRRVPVSAAKQSSFRAVVSTGAVKQVNTATHTNRVNVSKLRTNVFHKSNSPIRRSFYKSTAPNIRISNEKVNTVRVNGVNTAGQTANSTVKGTGVTTVKASAGYVWRPKMTDLNNVSKDNSGSWVSKRTKIHVDNKSAICVVKNPVYHSKTKHIEIRHHFIRDSYEKRLIEMVKIHTDNNVADLLTKAFDTSVPQDLGADKAVHTEGGDNVERVITTVAILDAAQDNDNISRTQTTAMLNTRSERVLEKPNEPPLSKGHTSGSGKGRMEHQFELMASVPLTPHDSALLGDYTPGSDEVKRLERQRKSSNSQPRRRKYRQFESSDDDLDEEDASKQGRGNDKIKPILCNFTLCLWMLEAEEESTMEFELIKIIKSMLEE